MDLYKMKILLIFLLGITYSVAQTLNADEQQFVNLDKQYSSKLNTIDSLKNILNQFLDELEQVKKQEPENSDKISAMLADALTQTNVIDKKEKELQAFEMQLNKKRNQLYRIYTFKIDSLRQRVDLALNDSEKETIESDLILLNNKRLYVSPLLPQLSFDPGLIEKISLSKSQNKKEQKIYKDYLDNALSEVDSNIINLKNRSDDIREVVRLNELAEDFMEDIEGSQFSGSFVLREQVVAQEDIFYGSDRFSNNPEADKVMIVKIYKRLSPFIHDDIDVQDFSFQDSVYTEDYLNLLEETEKTLRLYREKIKDKLQQ